MTLPAIGVKEVKIIITYLCCMRWITSVRSRLKNVFDAIGNEKLKHTLLQSIPFWIASFITGLVAIGFDQLFVYTEDAFSWIMQQHRWFIFMLAPACFFISWWLCKKFAPYAKGSGIPQVLAATELANPRYNHLLSKFLSLRIIVVKIISSLFKVLGGGIAGREGPTIQIAASIFTVINNALPAWWPKVSKKNAIVVGAASGLAAAFNTPLGGIVFAIEELSKTHLRFFKSALFTAVIIAGLTAISIHGPYLYLGYPDLTHVSGRVFWGVAIAAVMAGIAGAAMCKLILKLMAWLKSNSQKISALSIVLIASLLMALLIFFLGNGIAGTGKHMMVTMLFTDDKTIPWYMPVAKMGGLIISYCAGGAGGVFAPSLSMGAAFGSLVSQWFEYSAGNSNLVILCGMVAFLTGVTRSPFTAVILVLEMTDRHSVIFQLMLAGLLANLAAILIDRVSFYEHNMHSYMREVLTEDRNREEIPDAASDPAVPGADEGEEENKKAAD
ncbi:MAG: chloride channel protein [Ferruginibacter sp.]